MIAYLFIALALVLEAVGLGAVAHFGGSGWMSPLFLLSHALASALLALAAWHFLAAGFREPRWAVTLLLFNFAFFIPLLGIVGMLVAVVLASLKRREVVRLPFVGMKLPEFVLSLRDPAIKYSQGGIKSRLMQSAIPTPQRLQSLLALQGMPSRVSSPLLQDMLGDSSDDIRLVAYGLLDNREQKITAQIHRELTGLNDTVNPELRLMGLRHLAELYWEMIYAGLAQGDLRLHAINQAQKYVDEALAMAPQDAGLLLLKGRILHELGLHDEAQDVLHAAMAGGLPESRVLPYLVEIAFVRRDFATVRELVARLSETQVTPVMKNAIRFWIGSATERTA
jgi:tetratricopeptide (TPR) repeat protein